MGNQVYSYQKLVETNGHLDLTEKEMRTIAAFVMMNEKANQNAKYLEIGVFAGGTIKFLKNHTQTTQFVGVDLFEDFIISSNNTHMSGTFERDDVQRFLGDRVNLIKGDSVKIVSEMKDKFDFIFIDGNHTHDGTKTDFENASKLLAPGGQIGFHNCSAFGEPDFHYVKVDGGPWKLTQELIVSKEWRIIEEADRLRVFSRRA